MYLKKLPFILLTVLINVYSVAQQKKEYDLTNLAQEKKLSVVNRHVEIIFDPIKAVKLSEANGEGIAWLDGVTFSIGTIEVELRGQDKLQRSFIGIAFHGVNDSTYDAVYFRPFNFHSTDSVRKIHAVQYISHPLFTWHKLREERNGVFEKALINPPDPNGWFKARIEITEKKVTVYVNDDTQPSLVVDKISTTRSGKLGLWVGDGSGGEFSRLTLIEKM